MSVLSVNKVNFENEIKTSEKTVLLDFYADWCGPCRMVSPIVDEIAEEYPEILVGKINVDDCPELAVQFGIVSIPTLIVMNKGEVSKKIVGAYPKASIVEALGIK
ncbi:MAG: thioredoxin [Ruminococcaceae bacterium]|nr:thioredoxin [Oscillospiraceae bacterium]